MRERSGGNRRRRKFRQCDISAKVKPLPIGQASVRSALDARGMMGASGGRGGFRGRRLGGFRGYTGIGRWHIRRGGRKRRGRWGMNHRRWCLRAVGQEVSIERDQAKRE